MTIILCGSDRNRLVTAELLQVSLGARASRVREHFTQACKRTRNSHLGAGRGEWHP
jgi:hypothetical protein